MRFVSMLALVVIAAGCSPTLPEPPIQTGEDAVLTARQGWKGVHQKAHSATFSPDTIARFEPYTATLVDGEWLVRGTLPNGFHGTTPEAKIRQSDGSTSVSGVVN